MGFLFNFQQHYVAYPAKNKGDDWKNARVFGPGNVNSQKQRHEKAFAYAPQFFLPEENGADMDNAYQYKNSNKNFHGFYYYIFN